MSTEPLFSLRNPLVHDAASPSRAASALAAALVRLHLAADAADQCAVPRASGTRSAALPASVRTAPATEPVVQAGYRTTTVVLTPHMMQAASAEDVGRGGTLALRCTMCHGARGLSEADSPNLAGQYPAVIYKQLQDFKSGARPSAVMAPLVADLSDEDMRDLAAYYAYLPSLPRLPPGRRRPAAANRPRRRADAQHRPLRVLPRRTGQQGRQRVARRPAGRLFAGAARGLRLRSAAQRHQRPDAQRGSQHDAGRDGGRCPLLREPALDRRAACASGRGFSCWTSSGTLPPGPGGQRAGLPAPKSSPDTVDAGFWGGLGSENDPDFRALPRRR